MGCDVKNAEKREKREKIRKIVFAGPLFFCKTALVFQQKWMGFERRNLQAVDYQKLPVIGLDAPERDAIQVR